MSVCALQIKVSARNTHFDLKCKKNEHVSATEEKKLSLALKRELRTRSTNKYTNNLKMEFQTAKQMQMFSHMKRNVHINNTAIRMFNAVS